MALNFKDLGRRLLDSTTLDEKVGNFFRPQTGTLASTGRKWAQELAAKPAPSWVPQQVQQTAQNISDRGGFSRLKQEFTSNPAQFTPLSMKSAAVDTGRKLGSEDLGYGLRGALSLTPFQSVGKLTPKLSAIQQTTAPTTGRQQIAQSIGQTLYGTALTAPLSAGKTVLGSVGNVARNLAVGGTTGALMQGGSDLLTGNFSKDSLKQGALSGMQNSWVLPVTNSLTDAAILKLFPKAGLKITGAGVTDPFKLGKIKEGFGRLLTQSLAQVPAENTAFTFLNQLDDKTKGSFTENWMNNLPGNIVGNILSAGVSGSVNVLSNPQSRKVVTDAMKKTVDEWNTPVTMMGGEKMPMWKYKMMYETKPGFARLDLGVGKDTPKLSVEPAGKLQELETASKELGQAMNDTSKVDSVYQKYIGGKATNFTSKLDAIRNKMVTTNNDLYSARYAASKPLSVEPVGGKPIRAFHGTDEDFTEFDLSHVGKNTDSGMFGKGFYFTDDQAYAKTYARKTGKTKEVELDLKNPLILNTQADIPKIDVPNKTLDDLKNGATNYSKAFAEYAKANGYDGVIDNISGGKRQYVVFDPKKIKIISPSKPLSVEPVGGDLLAEAKKYKSAEEFVKAKEVSLKTAETGKPITTKLYHGSPDARFAEEFDPTKKGYFSDAPDMLPDNTDWNNLYGKTGTGFKGESATGNKGVSFTDDYQTAKSYSEKPAFDNQNSVPMVLERYVTLDNPKVYDLKGQKWNLNMEVEMRKALSEGHDGLVFKNILDDYHPGSRNVPTNNIIVLDPSKIQTKSQLTDIYNQSKGVAQGGLSDVKPTIKGVTSTTKPQIQTQLPELQRINTQIEAPKPVVSSDSIITPAGNLPKRSGELKKQLMEAQQNLEQSQAIAEQNKLIRDNFSPEQIKDINQLKILAKKSLDQGGDIETLRGKYPKLVESVTSHVREADQTIVGDSEALDFALSLPTKAETRVDMSEAKNLQKQLDPITKLDQAGVAATTGDKSVTSAVVEPTPKTVKGITTKQNKLDTANEVRARKKLDDEWQKAVFGEAQTRTTRQAEKELEQAIKRSTNEATFKLDTADGWKDKNALSLGTETMDRNFEDIMGKQAPELKHKLLEPVYKSEAQRTKFLNTEREQIKKLGIKAGSKESSLVQEYGEGNITAEQLKQQTANPEKIIKASEFIRGKYDEYLGQLNKVLTRNGYEPIPKRSDYFHHFQELTGAFDLLGVSLKAQDLPTDINGLTADFKPGKTFFSAALRRLGGEYKSDAIGGIDKYLEGASNQIYHTDNIQALRSFETALREKFAGTNHLSNFVANLSEYTNGIAGKKSMIDRAAESIVGRGIYGAATGLKKQVGANMVGANVSSALTNFIPLTQTLATTDKGSVLNAIMATIKNVGKDDGFIQASDFLTTRHGTDRLAKTLYENVADKAGWLFKNVDSFVSQVVTRSKYLEGIKKGMSESSAMDYANSWAKKLMAGRGKGEMPTLFNSQTLGAITQFQLEVKNQLSFMAKDIPRNFDKVGAASAIAQLFLYGYLFNNLYEKMTGRRPAFDPIGVGQRTYEDYTNPDMKKGQATKNLVSNVSNQLPFVSTFTGGRLPITSAIPNPMAVVNGESSLKKELMKPLQFVLPTGGGQIKKSVEGISAYNNGVSTSPSGRIRFAIPQTTTNKIRTGVFGQWSTPEAQKYLREGQSVLGEKQTKQVLESGDKVAEFAKVKAKSLFDKKIDAEKEVMRSGDKKVSEIGGVYLLKQDNGDIETIDISKEIAVPKYTGQTEVDKKLISTYKGKITSRINDIVKLVEAGKIEPTKAEEMIKTLKSTQSKLSGGKKPKKITIKTTKAPRVSFKLAKPTKMSVIKAPTSKRARISFKNYKPAKIKV